MSTELRTLRSGFSGSLERFPDRDALAIGGERFSYRALDRRARAIAATLDAAKRPGETKLTAVLGHRHPSAIAGILAALYRGHGYVPLNPMFPLERTRAMLARSRARALVIDPTVREGIDELFAALEEPCAIVMPDAPDVCALRARWPEHTFFGAHDLSSGDSYQLRDTRPDDIAYLLFTSGSTGGPKGVMVAHRNVRAFLDGVVERYAITEHDRFSNTFDLTFNLSVFDLFAAWERGACVCVPTAPQKLFPAKYVEQHALTVWFSVPSTAVLMSRLKMLRPGSYGSLRWALFCGEALTAEVAARFAEAAPRATVENLYGPTELTIACTLYRWDSKRSPAECERGVVPIGEPYPGMDARVVDEALEEVPRGEPGELIMTGPQTSLGYLDDPERTAHAFVRPPGESRVFYRTGDRVRWPAGGPLVYLGRSDHQIKVQGYRVELGEVESVLREASGAQIAVAVGWPRSASGADGIVAFVGADTDASTVLARARERLPGYMQPQRVVSVRDFPLNANGKVDVKALLARLEAEAA